MIVNFKNFDLENFVVRDVSICGIDGDLIFPQHMGAKFTQRNKIFRSSIWSKDGELLSAGLPKFKNIGEDPDNFPAPKNLKGAKIVTKEDGSLCVIDLINDQINMRTRGTASYISLENYKDFEFCLNKYPEITNFIRDNNYLSLLFEIVSPNMKIVLDYGKEPDFIFIGAINKVNYSLITQKELDKISKQIKVKRPKYYNFNHLDEIFDFCENNQDIEGFCIYFDNDRSIVKTKTNFYLKLHRMKAELGSFDRVVDFYFANGMQSYTDTYNTICETLDFEIAEQCKGDLSRICDANKEVDKIIEGMTNFVDSIKNISRKEAAEKIFQAYGKTNRASFCFSLLDGKELTADQKKKLLYQVTKK